jgi:hypothetical protein
MQEAWPSNQRHRVKPHLVDGEARLGEASILARRDGGWPLLWQGPLPQGHLPWSLLLAITGNGAQGELQD